MNLEEIKSGIPAALLERIDSIECNVSGANGKIAVFDLDNTLLEGDVGDAVFVQLKIEEKKAPLKVNGEEIPLTWQEYVGLLREKGKEVAYRRVITALAGTPVKTVEEITKKVMSLETPFLEAEDVKVPVPRPNKIMVALVEYLRSLDYDIYVISASNHYSVLYVAGECFGIPASNVHGMKPVVVDYNGKQKVFGGEIEEPVTVVEGKAQAYREMVGDTPPLISAGDSPTDIRVLNLVDPQGICIWVGKEQEPFNRIKEELDHPDTAFFLVR